MEVQMKAICEGRTTRNDVVQQNLEQYRAVFNRTVQQINVLKAVSIHQENFCPVVASLMGGPLRPSRSMLSTRITAEAFSTRTRCVGQLTSFDGTRQRPLQ